MQCEEYTFETVANISASHIVRPCWEDSFINKKGLSGMFSICALGFELFLSPL